MKFKTREDWLQAAIAKFRPTMKSAGAPIPSKIEAIVSWPKNARKGTIGQCFGKGWSKAGVTYVSVSPVLGDEPTRVLDVLLHELIHASGITGHGADFRKIALAVGLTGKMTATVAGPELTKRLATMVKQLGAYPHPTMLDHEEGAKKKKPRGKAHIRCISPVDETYSAWVPAKGFEMHGAPLCPISGRLMEVA